MAERPLAGIQVLDFSSVLMGPLATQILADYGADVIKVEAPDGDVMRQAGPMRGSSMGPMYMHANRNKRSIAIDLKTREGLAVALDLARRADVVVHNIRIRSMEQLGLGYAALRESNPRLVYAALCGFDQRGPLAAMPAVDDVIQAGTGLAGLFALAYDGPPQYVPMVVADRMVGISAAHAILAALFMRERTGRGQAIEVPMFETIAAMVLGDHLGGRSFEPAVGPTGYSRLLNPHRRPYRTRDGYLSIVIYTDAQWRRFTGSVASASALGEDPRFATLKARSRHYHEAYAAVAGFLPERSTAEWLTLCRELDIPAMPVQSADDLIDDPQLRAAGLIETVAHPSEGLVRVIGVPSRWSDAEMAIRRPAPRIGEHGAEILRELGYDEEAIDTLVGANAVTVPTA